MKVVVDLVNFMPSARKVSYYSQHSQLNEQLRTQVINTSVSASI